MDGTTRDGGNELNAFGKQRGGQNGWGVVRVLAHQGNYLSQVLKMLFV